MESIKKAGMMDMKIVSQKAVMMKKNGDNYVCKSYQ